MNPQNGQTPLDYLNQISPSSQKKAPIFALNLRTIIFAGILLVVLVIIFSVVSSAVSSAQKEPWQRFSVRLTTTEEIVNSAGSNIKNSQLRSINSDLKLYLANTKRDLTTPLTNQGITASSIPASITTQESGDKMVERLEDGRLNAKYDSTYAREMSYQTATLLALIQQLYNSSALPATKTYLKSAYDNLQPTYKALSEFSASNE